MNLTHQSSDEIREREKKFIHWIFSVHLVIFEKYSDRKGQEAGERVDSERDHLLNKLH